MIKPLNITKVIKMTIKDQKKIETIQNPDTAEADQETDMMIIDTQKIITINNLIKVKISFNFRQKILR